MIFKRDIEQKMQKAETAYGSFSHNCPEEQNLEWNDLSVLNNSHHPQQLRMDTFYIVSSPIDFFGIISICKRHSSFIIVPHRISWDSSWQRAYPDRSKLGHIAILLVIQVSILTCHPTFFFPLVFPSFGPLCFQLEAFPRAGITSQASRSLGSSSVFTQSIPSCYFHSELTLPLKGMFLSPGAGKTD